MHIQSQNFFLTYPQLVSKAMQNFVRVDGTPKVGQGEDHAAIVCQGAVMDGLVRRCIPLRPGMAIDGNADFEAKPQRWRPNMTTELAVRVEDKLFYNRYLVDAGRAHIKVRPHTVPSPALLTLLKACPARCYELNDKGQVEVTVDGCVECGTCRVIGEPERRHRMELSARRLRRAVQVRLS